MSHPVYQTHPPENLSLHTNRDTVGQTDRLRQTAKLRLGGASRKQNEVDGGERQTEKSQVFSSVAQRWSSLRAAARVQFSVPLQHSEPL